MGCDDGWKRSVRNLARVLLFPFALVGVLLGVFGVLVQHVPQHGATGLARNAISAAAQMLVELGAPRDLASKLEHLRGHDLVVLGLPRGGVPVAAEVARALGAPLDLIVVRKLGVPFQPEVAMGAIGEDGARVISHDLIVVRRDPTNTGPNHALTTICRANSVS